MPPFKDENILIIAPGSQTTLAQLGLPESFTPASHRFPTRMFPAPDGKTWEPYYIRERQKKNAGEDTAMEGTNEVQETELVEVMDEDEGAVWPLKEGRIENLPAFFALLQHIHNTFSPQLHTPILLVGQPCWTAKNHEDITQFIFEKFKTPGLCIIDSAIATSYAFGVANATVIDVGFEKTDITVITDFVISSRGTVSESGGEGMTRRLMELLKAKNFTRDMAEQLKKSSICEILSPGTPLPGTTEFSTVDDNINNPAAIAVASSGTTNLNAEVKITEATQENIDDKPIEDDGVLDIATIVTTGKTQDFLAKKEKEKAERAAARKATREAEKVESTTASKPARLPNSKRPRAVFHYEENLKDTENMKRQKTPDSQPAVTAIAVEEKVEQEEPKEESVNSQTSPNDGVALAEDEAARKEQQKTARKEEKKKPREDEHPHRIRRDIEIGIERFQAAENGYMDAIADTVYRVILSVDEVGKRHDAWESLIVCGCGSKVRGFKDALLGTLNNRYLVTPNSSSMLMGELPSSYGTTPSGTGAMTPNGSFTPQAHGPSSGAANPLLLAATTASNLAHNSSTSLNSYPVHPSRSQSPTSIKIVNPPSYFPEWKQYEEAVFLGSQIAAKVFFVNDQGQSKAFLTRLEFNEDGPTAIHQI